MAEDVQGLSYSICPTTKSLKFSQEFIEAIDAIDNGISQYPNDIKPKYKSRTDLSSRVGGLNPAWNQPTDSQTVDVRTQFCSSRCRFSLPSCLDPIRQSIAPYWRRVPWEIAVLRQRLVAC